jgi:hypothetical protein
MKLEYVDLNPVATAIVDGPNGSTVNSHGFQPLALRLGVYHLANPGPIIPAQPPAHPPPD